jgi:hypothetical protein
MPILVYFKDFFNFVNTSNYARALQREEKKLCISHLSKYDQNLRDS